MNRIEAIFDELKSSRRKALMPFITAGDPDLATTTAALPVLEQAGASIVELGIPFSDPIADGPVIQASMTWALDKGICVSDVFDMVRELRQDLRIGLVAMVSYSIVYRIGLNRFIDQAAKAGIDGFIFPDLAVEEAAPIVQTVKKSGLIMSMLIAPGTPIERARKIAELSSGFIYLLSRSGITGEQASLPTELPERISILRQDTDLPIAVGFGISNHHQVRQVVTVADAAIVGSAIVRRIGQHHDESPAAIARHVGTFVGQLAEGLSIASASNR